MMHSIAIVVFVLSTIGFLFLLIAPFLVKLILEFFDSSPSSDE
jgi:hypothetical protein